jgi:hypothetical protein
MHLIKPQKLINIQFKYWQYDISEFININYNDIDINKVDKILCVQQKNNGNNDTYAILLLNKNKNNIWHVIGNGYYIYNVCNLFNPQTECKEICLR